MDSHDPERSAKRIAIAVPGQDRPAYGRPTFDGVIAGKVSGRKWKNPKASRTSSIKVSHKRPSLEQRTMQKEVKKAYQDRMKELKEQIRQNKISKRKAKEEREKRKKENEARTGTVYEKITNPKKLKNMSKKQKKLLRKIPE
jgi:rRNA-processing protein CGR1